MSLAPGLDAHRAGEAALGLLEVGVRIGAAHIGDEGLRRGPAGRFHALGSSEAALGLLESDFSKAGVVGKSAAGKGKQGGRGDRQEHRAHRSYLLVSFRFLTQILRQV